MLEVSNPELRNEIISNIANHYGKSKKEILDELFDPEAENVMDYLTEPVRSKALPYYHEMKRDFNF